jgi:hypothetical protein
MCEIHIPLDIEAKQEFLRLDGICCETSAIDDEESIGDCNGGSLIAVSEWMVLR